MPESNLPPQAVSVAGQLAAHLDDRQIDYAIGGAIALGFWGAPRGTLDVYVTLFLPPEKPSHCLRLLQEIGCQATSAVLDTLREHGFCRVTYDGLNVDVFLPSIAFYEIARQRRKRVTLKDRTIWVWDAETLVVFKIMFFRRKDLADVEQIMRAQGPQLDRPWIRSQIERIYGARDLRLSQWDELSQEIAAA